MEIMMKAYRTGGSMEEIRQDAIETLRDELRTFDGDGLHALAQDLEDGTLAPQGYGRVWNGCPLSYGKGGRGSTSRDCRGQRANAFTLAWDFKYVSVDDVLPEVRAEIARRTAGSEVHVDSVEARV